MLRASRLPSLGLVATGESEARYADAANEVLASGERPPDIPLVTVLRWLAGQGDVLFHGSIRGDLEVLEPIRLTRDETPFGDQQAVFAASDPVWAIYFATLRRDAGFRSTRNVSFGVADALYPRWYYFSHNEEAVSRGRFGDGWLYVLPRAGFRREPLVWNLFDSAQWASPAAVTPLIRVCVHASDFPFANRVFPHRRDERVVTTVARAVALAWRPRRHR